MDVQVIQALTFCGAGYDRFDNGTVHNCLSGDISVVLCTAILVHLIRSGLRFVSTQFQRHLESLFFSLFVLANLDAEDVPAPSEAFDKT